jgi:uncharacterized protein YggE
MMSKTNTAVIMAAMCLALTIFGSIFIYSPKLQETLANYNKTPDLKTTLGVTESNLIAEDPNLIVPRDETIKIVTLDGSTSPIRTMSLSGTGKITVKANQAIIVLGVYTEAKVADWAVQENALKMADVVQAIKSLGILESDIQTIGYSINPIYNWEMKMTVGYQVTNTLQITLNNLSKIGAVIDKSSTAGANSINSVTFTVKDEDLAEFKLDAYAKAVADVKAKAKVISEGFGFELGGIQSINESYFYPQYRNTYVGMDMKSAGMEMAQTPIISGNLEVSATLNVVYTIN